MQADAPRTPPPRRKGEFPRRLGLYLLGVAIGLIMIGLIQQAKRAAVARSHQAEAETLPPQPARGGGEPSP